MKRPEEKALEAAKLELFLIPNTVFYTTILFSLKHQWTTSIKTAATDGLSLYVNPEFFMGLTKEERIGLLVHELLHVALDHMTRRGNRKPRRWNIAGDHIINLSIEEAGYYTLPAGALKDPRFKNMNTESAYNILDEEDGPGDDADPNAPFTTGYDVIYPDNNVKAQELEKSLADIIMKASIQAEMAGAMPGELPGEVRIHLQKVTNPRLPWNVILQNYFSAFAKDDYSWRRPNRRYLPDHYLPTLYSEAITHISIAVDASGSVSIKEFSYFISEIATIQETLRPESMTIIDFDTKINNTHTTTRDTDILSDLSFTGRGGTNIRPVMEWAISNNPTVLLIFTDGGFRLPDPKYYPPCPIVWLIHHNESFTAPIGEVIHYDIDNT